MAGIVLGRDWAVARRVGWAVLARLTSAQAGLGYVVLDGPFGQL
jgi:hypothetical protein